MLKFMWFLQFRAAKKDFAQSEHVRKLKDIIQQNEQKTS